MDVTFIVSISIFILFISLILVSAINYFTRVPESATVIELRGKAKDLFDTFFGSGGIATDERVTETLYRIPISLQENNGQSRTNEVISVTTEFDDKCVSKKSWNNTIRVYDQDFNELPSKVSYQEFCTSQYLNQSIITFLVNVSANQVKRVYVYSINNSNTTAPSHDLPIKGYWKFDDGSGTLSEDSSGYQNSGTLRDGTDTCAGNTCPIWTTGIFGSAIRFDGINDYVTVSDSDSTNITTAFMLSAWIKRNITGTDHFIIDHRNSAQNGYGMKITDDNNVQCMINAGSGSLKITGSLNIGAGGWTHVACNFNNRNMSIYINGSYHSSGTLTADATKGSGTTRIGSSYAGSQFMNGTIDEVRIYNGSLTASQISVIGTASNQFLDVKIFPEENITAISADKVQDLKARGYDEVKGIVGSGYDFRIEIREK